MKINSSELKTDRKWRSATGLNKDRFYKLLSYFKQSYLTTYGKDLNTRQVENDLNHYCIKDEEELLLFTLFSLKSGLTYDLLGLVCGMDASNAKRNQKIGLDILERTLKSLGHLPKRYFTTVDEFKAYFSAHKHLIIDATEQSIQRPSHPAQQKQSYSGKKNTYAKVNDYFK